MINIAFIVFGLIIIIIMLYIIIYLTWRVDHIEEMVSIPFKTFKNLYVIAPDKWRIDDWDRLLYYPFNGQCWRILQMKTVRDSIQLFFFKRNIDKNLRYENKMENTSELLKYWQNDINEFNNNLIKELQTK